MKIEIKQHDLGFVFRIGPIIWSISKADKVERFWASDKVSLKWFNQFRSAENVPVHVVRVLLEILTDAIQGEINDDTAKYRG